MRRRALAPALAPIALLVTTASVRAGPVTRGSGLNFYEGQNLNVVIHGTGTLRRPVQRASTESGTASLPAML